MPLPKHTRDSTKGDELGLTDRQCSIVLLKALELTTAVRARGCCAMLLRPGREVAADQRRAAGWMRAQVRAVGVELPPWWRLRLALRRIYGPPTPPDTTAPLGDPEPDPRDRDGYPVPAILRTVVAAIRHRRPTPADAARLQALADARQRARERHPPRGGADSRGRGTREKQRIPPLPSSSQLNATAENQLSDSHQPRLGKSRPVLAVPAEGQALVDRVVAEALARRGIGTGERK